MNSAKKTLLAATAAVAAVLPLHQARATNGMLPHCVGTDSCGMGGAGMALGGNAVSAAVNPALAGKAGNQVMLNAGWFKAERTMDSNGGMGTTDGTITSENPDFPNGSLGVNYTIDPQWSVNVAMFPGGGGAVRYSPKARINTGSGVNGWDSTVDMQIMLGQASVAYTPTPDVSFGAGLVFGRMSFKTDMAIADGANSQTAGRNRDEHMYGAGFRVGLTGKVTENLDVAATARSPIWFEDFNLYQDVFWGAINLPWEAGAGFAYKLNETTDIAFDGKIVTWRDTPSIGRDPAQGGFGWQTVPVLALGVQHRLDDQWTVRAGWNYGESPIDSEVVFANALFPAIVEHHITAGASYKISDAWELGLSAYWAPEKSLTDSGSGDTYSQNGAGTKISHYQYGAQASLKWNF